MEKKKIKIVVVKVGSSLIANYKTGLPKLNWINSFINDLNFLLKKRINEGYQFLAFSTDAMFLNNASLTLNIKS